MNEQLELFNIQNIPEEHAKPNILLAKTRLNSPQRDQIEFIHSSIDDLIADDHPVRDIWNYVNQMDMSSFLQKIKSRTDSPGRPAIDPKILFALWIYAISEGIGSARVIDRYCNQHLAFRWLCGGVSVNYHSISDFRKNHAEEFDELIALTVARLINVGLITMERVSQDGMKVRASAGSSSFRRKPKLKELLIEAKERVKALRKEIDEDPTACLDRRKAAKKRAAEERMNRIEQALKEHKKTTIEASFQKKKHYKPFTQEEKGKIRASTTDFEAKKMKMANGGFNPAYNMQISIDTGSRFILGAYVVNKVNDTGQLVPMFEHIKKRYKKIPKEWLVDQGYLDRSKIAEVQKSCCKVYVNPKSNEKVNIKCEDDELTEWRNRMNTDEAKEIYKDRASNSEWANAGMRNRGLKQLLVRGLKNVQNVLNLHVLSHNILRACKFGYVW